MARVAHAGGCDAQGLGSHHLQPRGAELSLEDHVLGALPHEPDVVRARRVRDVAVAVAVRVLSTTQSKAAEHRAMEREAVEDGDGVHARPADGSRSGDRSGQREDRQNRNLEGQFRTHRDAVKEGVLDPLERALVHAASGVGREIDAQVDLPGLRARVCQQQTSMR